ncbi:MAG: endopeptidase La [Desulfobacterales bacterium]
MAETDKDDLVSLLEDSDGNIDIPETMPLLPVRDVVIFIDMVLPLFIGRERSVKAVDKAMGETRLLFLSTQRDPSIEDPKPDDIYRVGTICRILRILKLPDGHFKVLVQGLEKGRIKRYVGKKAFFNVKVEVIKDTPVEELQLEHQALMRNIRENCEKILSIRGEYSSEIGILLDEIEDPGKLADLVSSNLKLKIDEAQGLLEISDPIERLHKVNDYLSREVDLSMMQAKIQSEVRDEISKNQRDYFLREQVRAINKELGEFDDRLEEITEYQKQIKKAKLPKEAAKEADKQLRRLEQMHPDSSEASVIRTYLDWILDLPWSKTTKDKIDIPAAKKTLDKHHYGLEKIKDRILEYLSVRKLNPNKKGQILCFAGPPGVGKTSLGQAIAKAMNRKFFRVSLGGIRDEAEIRGHRRTYVGALPGRIIQGIRRAGSNNPVFMLDEIDKVGSDFRGDPSSALLEVLDPEQNFSFEDHYLDVPFDLSQVMFITTANILDTIPPALRDRMEVLRLAGYTLEEKVKIATRYLIPRQREANGLKTEHIAFTNGAVKQIISGYTREAGVRNLEREIGNVCRGVAASIAKREKESVKINTKNLTKYLGPVQITNEMKKRVATPGVVMGLAWTEAGGDILFIEATAMRGNGRLTLTGQLGDVMKESATAALSYVRSNAATLGIEDDYFQKHDIHIHVPAGAIPKDGPSAGVTMLTAITSVLTGATTHKDLAMTGEITLRGQVMPVGGIKEKVLAAHRSGIKTIIMPALCEKDLVDVPKNVRSAITFHFVDKMKDVLKIALNQ